MSKRFSALKPSVAVFNRPIDRETFRWTKRTLTGSDILPVPVAEINGNIYQIASFESVQKSVILITPGGFEEALTLSVELYGADTVTFAEWLAVYKKCAVLGIDFTAMPLPVSVKKDIKRCLQLFTAASRWNETLIFWLEQKNVPWKTVFLLAGMDDSKILYVTDYVLKKTPSLQSFRQFVESVTDFADKINSVTYDSETHAVITDRRTPAHAEADRIVNTLNGAVTVANKDNWESSALNWNFVIKSAEQYETVLKLLVERRGDVNAIYTLLGE